MKGKNVILDWLFPRRCPICDNIVTPMGEKICPACRRVPVYISEPKCKKCGKRLIQREREYCFDCTNRQHVYDQGAALYEYHSVKNGIHRFKYQGRCEHAEFYAAEMAVFLGAQIKNWEAQALVAVPLHKSKQRMRGYNQAQLLADALGARLGIPVRQNFITRCKKTLPQKDLDERARQNNLKRAFKICPNDVKLKVLIIVDDIYTTGSTIDAMATEMKKAGVQKIYYIALAIGDGF